MVPLPWHPGRRIVSQPSSTARLFFFLRPPPPAPLLSRCGFLQGARLSGVIPPLMALLPECSAFKAGTFNGRARRAMLRVPEKQTGGQEEDTEWQEQSFKKKEKEAGLRKNPVLWSYGSPFFISQLEVSLKRHLLIWEQSGEWCGAFSLSPHVPAGRLRTWRGSL